MQEEVEQRSVTLAISASKLTARVLRDAINKYLNYRRYRKSAKKNAEKPPADIKPCGKQTVEELIGQNQGVKTIPITKSEVRSFERVARKYGVDFAIRRDSSGEKPRFLVFFKGRDEDAITAAFKEYAAKAVKRNKGRKSVLDDLHQKVEQAKDDPNKARRKELER